MARLRSCVPRSENDARLRLDQLAQSSLVEEEGPIGPMYFGPRIRKDSFPVNFTLPRDTPKYKGTSKLEDWLIDCNIAVGIAMGNKRVAVRYVPLLLTCSARTWLNSVLTDNINA
ncbi:DNA mismatch repair protein Mlh1 [Hordeum vulgare]|nr:DNA mismatch repair protein Mlh1 [Hordeum vulgare]